MKKTALTVSLKRLAVSAVLDVYKRQAARGSDGALSFRELSEQSNAVANTLLARRGSGERLTAIMLPRGTSVLVSTLGILKAGQGFLCLLYTSRCV